MNSSMNAFRSSPSALSHHGRWNAPQEGDQLGDRANTKDLDPLDQFRLTGLAQRNDHPRETRLLSRQRGGQDAAYGAEATVQPEFTQ
jgi:hypothetical protein